MGEVAVVTGLVRRLQAGAAGTLLGTRADPGEAAGA
jgi:hypothetical protein